MIHVFEIRRNDRLVAQGTEFDSGAVVVAWLGETPSVVVHANMDNVKAIHGHEGTDFVSIARLDERRQHLLNNEAQDHCENVSCDFTDGNPKYMWEQREKALDILRTKRL